MNLLFLEATHTKVISKQAYSFFVFWVNVHLDCLVNFPQLRLLGKFPSVAEVTKMENE